MRPIVPRGLTALLFAVLSAAPIEAQDYGVRPGDQVTIDFYTAGGEEVPEIAGDRTVDREGNLFLPLVGTVEVDALDAVGIRVKLERLYEDIYPDAVIEVDVLLRVSVTGSVARPGTFYLDPTMTVLQAIGEAGGAEAQPASSGRMLPPDMDAVRLVRDGVVQELNLQAENPAPGALDIRVASGDWIYVPTQSSVRSLRDNVSFWGQLASLVLTVVVVVNQLGG